MVDSVKGANKALQGNTSNQQKAKSSSSQQSSFQSLSSGNSVAETSKSASKEAAAVVRVNRSDTPKTRSFSATLNDAVRFSGEAAKSLNQLGEGVKSELEKTASSDRPDLGVGLNTNIAGLLGELRDRASSAIVQDVIGQNIAAAEAKIEDVERAQERAQSASSLIQFSGEEALGAHGGELTSERVIDLLRTE